MQLESSYVCRCSMSSVEQPSYSHRPARAVAQLLRPLRRSDRIPAARHPAMPTSPSARRWSRPGARSVRRIRCCAAPAPRCAPVTRDRSRRCRWRSPPARRRSAAVPSAVGEITRLPASEGDGADRLRRRAAAAPDHDRLRIRALFRCGGSARGPPDSRAICTTSRDRIARPNMVAVTRPAAETRLVAAMRRIDAS